MNSANDTSCPAGAIGGDLGRDGGKHPPHRRCCSVVVPRADVKDGQIGAAELFATIFQAVGIDHKKDYFVGARPIPLTNPGTKPVTEVLA